MNGARGNRERGTDGGWMAIEAAILVPTLIAFLLLIIGFGRVMLAGNAVDAAAKAAAREVSIARGLDRTGAEILAKEVTRDSLKQEGVDCDPQIRMPRYEPDQPVGEVGRVTIVVRCTVDLSDIAIGGMPGSKTMESSFTSVVDHYRERG